MKTGGQAADGPRPRWRVCNARHESSARSPSITACTSLFAFALLEFRYHHSSHPESSDVAQNPSTVKLVPVVPLKPCTSLCSAIDDIGAGVAGTRYTRGIESTAHDGQAAIQVDSLDQVDGSAGVAFLHLLRGLCKRRNTPGLKHVSVRAWTVLST